MLKREQVITILQDIITAEQMPLPGPAKQGWVLANQTNRHSASAPPSWIWLLALLLEKLIPALLDYLKKKFGAQWPEKATAKLNVDKLPWE